VLVADSVDGQAVVLATVVVVWMVGERDFEMVYEEADK